MKTKIFYSFCISFLFCSVLLFACGPADDTPPNIVLIMADDLGYGDIAWYGSEHIKTPAIDLLASEGMKFTDYHSNGPACTPTRAALMTGKYQQRVGLEGVIYVKGESRKTGLDASELTIADLKEEHNLIDQNTEIAKEMKTLLTNWENEMEEYKQKTK